MRTETTVPFIFSTIKKLNKCLTLLNIWVLSGSVLIHEWISSERIRYQWVSSEEQIQKRSWPQAGLPLNFLKQLTMTVPASVFVFRECCPMHFLWKCHVLASMCPWWQVMILSQSLWRFSSATKWQVTDARYNILNFVFIGQLSIAGYWDILRYTVCPKIFSPAAKSIIGGSLSCSTWIPRFLDFLVSEPVLVQLG